MGMTGVNVAFVQETVILFWWRRQTERGEGGGVALLVKERERFRVENEKAMGPNVILFKLITGDYEGEEERSGVDCFSSL